MWEEIDKCKKRRGNCPPFSLPVTFPRSQVLGWGLPFVEVCPGSWTKSDNRRADYCSFPEPCDVPGLPCASLLRTERRFSSHHLAILKWVHASLLLTPNPAATALVAWFEAPVDDTCHPQSNLLPIWVFHYLGLRSFRRCVYLLEVLMSPVAWPMALLWAWHLSSCPAALARRLSLPSSLLSALVLEVVPDLVSYFLSILCFCHTLTLTSKFQESKWLEAEWKVLELNVTVAMWRWLRQSIWRISKGHPCELEVCHLKNPNLAWLSKWSCVLGDGSDGRHWVSGSLSLQTFGHFLQLLLRWKPSFLDTGAMMNWTCFPGFQKTKFFPTLTFNIWDKCINPEEAWTWEPTVHSLRTIHTSLDNLRSHPLLSREKKIYQESFNIIKYVKCMQNYSLCNTH